MRGSFSGRMRQAKRLQKDRKKRGYGPEVSLTSVKMMKIREQREESMFSRENDRW
jgi:hypothetical protein